MELKEIKTMHKTSSHFPFPLTNMYGSNLQRENTGASLTRRRSYWSRESCTTLERFKLDLIILIDVKRACLICVTLNTQ